MRAPIDSMVPIARMQGLCGSQVVEVELHYVAQDSKNYKEGALV
jgi:hypothetical protein